MNKKLVAISTLVCLSLISGCLHESKDEGVVRTIIKTDTIKIAETIYGEVNVSYQYIKERGQRNSGHYYVLTVDIEEPPNDLYLVRVDFSSGSGAGTTTMEKCDDNNYSVNIELISDMMDIWIKFFERGEKVYNETTNEYGYKTILTEMISASISLDHDASVVEESVSIEVIRYGFDLVKTDQFNITFNISGLFDPDSIKLRYKLELRNPVVVERRGSTYGSFNGTNYAILYITDIEKLELESLIFSISCSNEEDMRAISPIIQVSFEEQK